MWCRDALVGNAWKCEVCVSALSCGFVAATQRDPLKELAQNDTSATWNQSHESSKGYIVITEAPGKHLAVFFISFCNQQAFAKDAVFWFQSKENLQTLAFTHNWNSSNLQPSRLRKEPTDPEILLLQQLGFAGILVVYLVLLGSLELVVSSPLEWWKCWWVGCLRGSKKKRKTHLIIKGFYGIVTSHEIMVFYQLTSIVEYHGVFVATH